MSFDGKLRLQFVREIPQLKDWHSYRFVSIGEKIYVVGFNDKKEAFEVLIFNAKNYTISSLNLPDKAENRSVPALMSFFAVAHGNKIYICGCKNPDKFSGQLFHCLDTETLEWTDAETSGDIPHGRTWGNACIIGNKIFICIDYFQSVSEGKPRVYSLDLQSKYWTCQCRHPWSLSITPRGAISYGRRMYVLFIKWTNIGDNNDCIGCYDTAEGYWRWLDPPRMKYCYAPSYTIFGHAGEVYILLSEALMMGAEHFVYAFSDKDDCEKILLKYCPRSDFWTQVKYKGTPPGRQFESVVVIEDKAFLFCSVHKEVYMLDFFPSLQSLSLHAVSQHQLDVAALPAGLKNEIQQSAKHTATSE